MTEKLSRTPENHESGPENRGEKAEAQHEHAEKSHEHEHAENLDQIRHKAETAAISSDKTRTESSAPAKPKEAYASKEVKAQVYKQTLKRVRRGLSPVGRTGSKIIHQRAVEAVSNVTAKTAARPSGMLGGGIVAFTGTAIYYYSVRHNNYNYNFTVFLILLAGGFVVGWIAELLLKSLRHSN